VARQLVLAFRMAAAGVAPGPEGAYLARARSLCARGEALGGRLVAWSAAILAMAWDIDSMEEAILLAASIREEALSQERSWACGIAEGELEALAPDGARMHLAWGDALLAAGSLARVAKPGEVLVDGEVRALRAGQLALVGARAAMEGNHRVRGWRLDLEHPWRRAAQAPVPAAGPGSAPGSADATDRHSIRISEPSFGDSLVIDTAVTQESPIATFADAEVSTADVIEIVEASAAAAAAVTAEIPAVGAGAHHASELVERVRRLALGARDQDAAEALAELRRARARVEGASATAKCQASLALAMTLSIAGRAEEALLEALDALARARESDDTRATGACMALLAKLYSSAGYANAATRLREAATTG
jgi:hypothetical protein